MKLMTKIKDLVKILDVEIWEEFGISKKDGMYRFTDNTFEWRYDNTYEWNLSDGAVLLDVLFGRRYIIKRPWKPVEKETYYYVKILENKIEIEETRFFPDVVFDLMNYALGNCFRIQEKAEEHKEEIIDRLKSIYEKGGN